MIRLILTLSIFLPILISAQNTSPNVINSAGSTISSSGYSVSYSVAEPITSTFVNNTNTLSQGFLQPEINIRRVAVVEVNGETFSIYPNPTNGLIITKTNIKDVSFEVFAQNGQLVGIYSNPNGIIDLSEKADGAYFIRMIKDNKVSSFQKLIKIN
jgi:Secretion system C-terminal sorting domain